MYRMTREEIKAYLNRIGIKEIQPPTKEYLFVLHQAHVNALSWQTVDIFAGKPAAIGFEQSVRLVLNDKSGYCFHLNGAFSSLLHSLGYKVHLHRAGVQPLGEQPRVNSFHLSLSVDLVNEAEAEEQWIVDVGLGDMPYEPIPLRYGMYEQGPMSYKVVQSGVVPQGWRLVHDPLASFAGVDIDAAVLGSLEEFMPKHEFYSRSPESPWARIFLVRQRNASQSNELRGCIWSKRDKNGLIKVEVASKSEWLELLNDVFGERLAGYSALEKDDLWKRVEAAHVEWKATKALS
ncbi:arylamine N-acetyltransferase family protein [Paenibacillus sp. OAS669]|uniref:arylamine N-acetyltransferase family protein n=1 Tax=Paenibacillus sp. OAS669 TaxID=2663821 RepID=UPI001789868E|nr:arylamine N-acetyltransferase [Paenibacillus sp. OAS669]MBE1445222.1 arylamine N-acetyltransferase [Paenibacillus sp. OAS669]